MCALESPGLLRNSLRSPPGVSASCGDAAAFSAEGNVTSFNKDSQSVRNTFSAWLKARAYIQSGYSINRWLIKTYLFNARCSKYETSPAPCMYAQLAQASARIPQGAWRYYPTWSEFQSLNYLQFPQVGAPGPVTQPHMTRFNYTPTYFWWIVLLRI